MCGVDSRLFGWHVVCSGDPDSRGADEKSEVGDVRAGIDIEGSSSSQPTRMLYCKILSAVLMDSNVVPYRVRSVHQGWYIIFLSSRLAASC